jgi:ABC-type iron transport system FetAB ATPase subunit
MSRPCPPPPRVAPDPLARRHRLGTHREAPTPTILEAVDLSARVGERVLFSGVGFALAEGQRARVVGPSGTGKTVLMRILAGLQAPCSGSVRLGGRDLDAWGGPAWRARVALLAQHPPVLPGTPADTAGLLAGLTGQRGRAHDDPRDVAARLALPHAAWTRDWAALSGGERQRVHLALALALRPDVLLLDEPTSALDPTATDAVLDALTGHAAIWVTHDAALAARLEPDLVVDLAPEPA